MTYSVAIRTLGLAPDSLRQTLEGVFAQTVAPVRVAVYMPRGYEPPEFRVATEEYFFVDKGMISQRVLPYDELRSDCILMLDDDIVPAPDCAGRLLADIETMGLDLAGVDVFRTHMLGTATRLKAALLNMVFPHHHSDRAFVLRPWGSFAYPASQLRGTHPTDTLPGPLMMWRRSSFLSLDMADELWLEKIGFAYGEDALESYKAVARGMKAAVNFDISVRNLEARTASDPYRNNPHRHFIRAKAMTMTWWRMLYKPYGNSRPGSKRVLAAGLLKYLWAGAAMACASLALFSTTPLLQWIRGVADGIASAKSEEFSSVPPYISSRP